jgi:hypothetical protein
MIITVRFKVTICDLKEGKHPKYLPYAFTEKGIENSSSRSQIVILKKSENRFEILTRLVRRI